MMTTSRPKSAAERRRRLASRTRTSSPRCRNRPAPTGFEPATSRPGSTRSTVRTSSTRRARWPSSRRGTSRRRLLLKEGTGATGGAEAGAGRRRRPRLSRRPGSSFEAGRRLAAVRAGGGRRQGSSRGGGGVPGGGEGGEIAKEIAKEIAERQTRRARRARRPDRRRRLFAGRATSSEAPAATGCDRSPRATFRIPHPPNRRPRRCHPPACRRTPRRTSGERGRRSTRGRGQRPVVAGAGHGGGGDRRGETGGGGGRSLRRVRLLWERRVFGVFGRRFGFVDIAEEISRAAAEAAAAARAAASVASGGGRNRRRRRRNVVLVVARDGVEGDKENRDEARRAFVFGDATGGGGRRQGLFAVRGFRGLWKRAAAPRIPRAPSRGFERRSGRWIPSSVRPIVGRIPTAGLKPFYDDEEESSESGSEPAPIPAPPIGVLLGRRLRHSERSDSEERFVKAHGVSRSEWRSSCRR